VHLYSGDTEFKACACIHASLHSCMMHRAYLDIGMHAYIHVQLYMLAYIDTDIYSNIHAIYIINIHAYVLCSHTHTNDCMNAYVRNITHMIIQEE